MNSHAFHFLLEIVLFVEWTNPFALGLPGCFPQRKQSARGHWKGARQSEFGPRYFPSVPSFVRLPRHEIAEEEKSEGKYFPPSVRGGTRGFSLRLYL